MAEADPRQCDISALVRYEPNTGKLFWKRRPRSFFKNDRDHKIWNTRYAEREAFNRFDGRYLSGRIFGRSVRAHQIIWALSNGCWPDGPIDHINGQKADNRPENLRCVSRVDNARNTKLNARNHSGVSGVGLHSKNNNWVAQISAEGRPRHIGSFATKEEAVAARKAAEQELGYHPNHGRAA